MASKNTNRYGEPIKSVSVEEAIDEFSKWDMDSLIAFTASLMVTHHAEEFRNLVYQIKKDFQIGEEDELIINM